MPSIPFPSIVGQIGRQNIDTIVGYMGTECWLYKIVTRVARDSLRSTFNTTFDTPIRTKVAIEWNPEVRRLQSLGLYTDEGPGDVKPILAYFKFEDDPKQNDYIELDVEYSVGDILTNRFEVVDRKFHGKALEQHAVWVLAPIRKVPA